METHTFSKHHWINYSWVLTAGISSQDPELLCHYLQYNTLSSLVVVLDAQPQIVYTPKAGIRTGP